MKTIYIAGPVSDMPNLNRPEFEAMAEHLRKMGHKVINPHEVVDQLDLHPVHNYEDIMRVLVAEMCTYADEVVTLKGWENSPGANREVAIARLMKIEVKHFTHYHKPTSH